MDHSSACLQAPILDQSAASTPMTQSSEYLTTPRIDGDRSRFSTPATSISIPSRPNTPSFNLPSTTLDASPVKTTKPKRVLTLNDYATAASEPSAKNGFPRMSRAVPMMRTAYDVVVIGSGYGGAVAASRSVRAGKQVCVLELGKEKHPGEYPECAIDALKELHVSGNIGSNYCPTKPIGKGKKTDLYNLVLGEGQNAFVAHALGGTSLLNANVFLEADTRTLQLPNWPKEIRQRPESLKKYYDRAASVLEPIEYPETAPSLPKLNLLKKQAEAMGWGDKFKRVPQTTTFVEGRNSTGVQMKASQLLGQDCTGVNDGSKNTVLMNYLADAWYNGAEMFCECEVRHVKRAPDGNGWIVLFAWHGEKRGKFKEHFYKDLMWVRARELVFFGAGTLGTTEILLRSREQGLKMSSHVGQSMSGNGDILAFGYNTNEEANSMGTTTPIPGRPVGPTITGVVDMRDAYEDVMDGFVLEEGAIPSALTGFLQGLLEITPEKVQPTGESSRSRLARLLSRARSAFQGAHAQGGALNKTQVYLVMSHDSNEATLTLENGKPFLRFYGIQSNRVERLYDIMAEFTTAIGGTFVNNPFNIKALGQEQITVHPIGGAVMSSDGTGEEGVVNHLGEIFTGDTNEVHDGLVVVDGSIIPCALGVNPFATITALAERCVEGVFEKRGGFIDFEMKNGHIDLFGEPAHCIPLTADMIKTQQDIRKAKGSDGARFTEIMDGFINIGDNIEDVNAAFTAAQSSGSTARFYLTIDAWSTRTLVSSKDHGANITGTLICAALSKDPFMIVRGTFKLFSDDERQAETKNLVYDFDMAGTDGTIIHFHGYKVINSSIAFSVKRTWTATTTLFVTLTSQNGHKLLGKGKMFVGKRNFATQLQTMQAVTVGDRELSLQERLAGKVRFVDFFTRNIARLFFIPFSALQYPQMLMAPTPTPEISVLPEGFFHKIEPTETINLITSDGIDATLYYWAPPPFAPKTKAMPILFITGSAYDHRMYHLTTVEETPIDYFNSRGHPIYSIVHRTALSKWAEHERNYTVYDGRLDIAAAVEYIQNIRKDEKFYIVAHCAGSMGLASGLFDGTISPKNIAGVTNSAVFCHPIYGKLNRAKASLPLAARLLWATIQNSNHYYSCVPDPKDSYAVRALDNILRFYPTCGEGELCSSVVCHRSSLMFGRLWSHRHINEATHRNLHTFIGGISKGANMHLAAMGRAGVLLANDDKVITTQENIRKIKGIDFFFIVGKENDVFSPEGLIKSSHALRAEGVQVRVEVLENRGHLDLWMGADEGAKDVWKKVLNHVEDMEDKYYGL